MTVRIVISVCIILMVFGLAAAREEFSIDPLSPEVPAMYSPADIILKGGGLIRIPAASLGLIAADNIDAFSYGTDIMWPGPPQGWAVILYSVTRATAGAPGNVISGQVAGNGAAGDIFDIVKPLAVPVAGPFFWRDATRNGLTPLPLAQSDLDGLAYYGNQVYLSVDIPTAVRLGRSQADILYQANPGPGVPPPVLYAGAAALGLVAGDDIDALAIHDLGQIGVLDAGDEVYISLTPVSPSAAVLGSASIIRVFPGPPAVFHAPAVLGLLATDDLNALTGFDPCLIPHFPGDANDDGQINIADAVYMINGIFGGGFAPTPFPVFSGDANCDCAVNVGDVVYIINFVFRGGPAPCDCNTWMNMCGPELR